MNTTAQSVGKKAKVSVNLRDYGIMAALVLIIIVFVTAIDLLSARIRKMFI